MTRSEVIEGLEFCAANPNPDDNGWSTVVSMNLVLDAIDMLKAQEPRVMTLEDVEHAEVAYAEDKDKTDIIPVLVLGRMCEHVALVKPHVDEEAITRMIIPRVDEYDVRWRCWTSRPTDEQREATPWK